MLTFNCVTFKDILARICLFSYFCKTFFGHGHDKLQEPLKKEAE